MLIVHVFDNCIIHSVLKHGNIYNEILVISSSASVDSLPVCTTFQLLVKKHLYASLHSLNQYWSHEVCLSANIPVLQKTPRISLCKVMS